MAYYDLKPMSENERIRLIGRAAVVQRQNVGFIVEDQKKAERYIKKLKELYPTIVVLMQFKGPTSSTYSVKVGPPASSAS